MDLPLWECSLRLAAALAVAAVVGWEREAKDRPAGLRTHMLVAMGAALCAIIAIEIGGEDGAIGGDPVRLIAAVVGGVGFLGAGAIIQSRGRVKGLTTAASIWVVAAIGLAAGCGLYGVAGIAAGFALVTLGVLSRIERRREPDEAHAD